MLFGKQCSISVVFFSVEIKVGNAIVPSFGKETVIVCSMHVGGKKQL